MPRQFYSRYYRRPLTCALLIALVAGPALAQTPLPATATPWNVQGAFAKNAEARSNLSGAACAVTTPPFASCLVVNDEKKYAQFFSIKGTTLVPDAVIRLLGDGADSDPDGEGGAYADGFFYVIGSHGRGRHSGKLHDSSFLVFRFPVDAASGKPTFPVTDAIADPAIKASPKLRAALKAAAPFGSFAEQPLAGGGVNLEGIAVRGPRLYVGLRGPSIGDKGFMLSAALDGVFGSAPLDAKPHELALGPGAGIRDLAALKDGLLVLSGPVQEQGAPYSIWRWSEDGTLKRLAVLALKSGKDDPKAETLLLLDETPNNYRVLVMFDGIENGGPIEFNVPR